MSLAVSVVARLISRNVIRQFCLRFLRLPIRFLLKCFSFIIEQKERKCINRMNLYFHDCCRVASFLSNSDPSEVWQSGIILKQEANIEFGLWLGRRRVDDYRL